jgi:hypothetical protein
MLQRRVVKETVRCLKHDSLDHPWTRMRLKFLSAAKAEQDT